MPPIKPSYASAVQQMRAYRALRSHVRGVLEPYGINVSQWAMLGILYGRPGGVRPSDFAAELDVSAPLITTLLGSLQEGGLVTESEGTPDRRAKRISLTRKGSRLVDGVEAALVRMGDRMFAAVSADEMRAYHKVLDAMVSFGGAD